MTKAVSYFLIGTPMQPKRLIPPLLVVLLALLAVPAIAHAEQSFPSCGLPSNFPPEWAERCAQEHKVAEEAEKRAAEEAAKKAAEAAEEAAKAAAQASKEAAKAAEEQAPATRLELKVFSHHSDSYAEPGYTAIGIMAAPYNRVTFTGNHGVGTSRFRLLPGTEGITEPIETGDVYKTYAIKSGSGLVTGAAGINVRWSCRLRGQTIHFTVQSLGGSGPPLVRTGTFRIRLTARWCVAAKRRESSEEARHRAEERQEAAERARREKEAQRHELEQWETNCRKLGGTVVWLHVGSAGAVAPVCRGPNGGTIEVPA